MLSEFRFFLNIIGFRFADALASHPESWQLRGDWELWAAYRLGLYRTVAENGWRRRIRHGGVAAAVSLAACGRSGEAREAVGQLVAKFGKKRYLVSLADAIAPFDAELAFAVLDGIDAPPVLRAALQLRIEGDEKAGSSISALIRQGEQQRFPELLLLATNALGGDPAVQLQRLNDYLKIKGLPQVGLVDPSLPPGAGNLVAGDVSRQVNGPLLSVLMTTFCTADRVRSAIRSILGQTYKNIELIVVDDASTDGTGEIVQEIAREDARVKYLRMPCNVGTYVAKSIAFEHSRGEFVTCHDSDDWSHPLRFEKQIQPLLENQRLVATTSQWVRIQDDGVFYARPVHPLARLNPASPLFRRDLVAREMGLWDLVRTGADSEFHARLRLVFGRTAVKRIALPLAFGAHRPNSLMTASDTGYCASGMSPVRLGYWEAWTRWQIAELRAGRRPRLFPLREQRQIRAPDEITVPREHIERCYAELCRW
ncbi:MAG TPA: glycosyltransferase family 2 protein [Nitrospira sp.]|uniref:glycosyltransferase family 2 protein n=1 Tax=Cognatazoarcus halotolerans TaxID=2686016 RepID=UPI0013579ADB|nr:glycosyltransferase family 2 protein [Cognatazoarcus halotolerans]MCB1898780.1 glycosyltransferase family 2 protein [Rhodocyclaceae bacterium]MCP5311096.1 glycosyltransferase family 2 protein [Zoogloeaceae bacterium]HQV12096.1 glycosyltransferase family 2 protein [Nitrospira sp.]